MEYDLIEKIASFAGTGYDSSILKGIGDDCALIRPPGGGKALAITTDVLVEGIHFDMAYFSPYHIGWKTAACNLSDMAAVGAVPRWALLNLAVPPGLPEKFWDSFSRGLFTCLGKWDVKLVGGDTVSSPKSLTTGLTMAGEVSEKKWLGREGAMPGDLIFCSGHLGESACGLALLVYMVNRGRCRYRRRAWWKNLAGKHLKPQPRVDLGMALANAGTVTSCIDLSDGLATDLAHVCKMSGVKATVHAQRLPLSRALKTASRKLGLNPLRLAVTGGEDFELLWTVAPEHGERIQKLAFNLGIGASCIGRISHGRGVWLKTSSGLEEISFQGFEHKT